MSIAKPSIARNKLRQERQGEERHQHSPGHAPNSRYAAPNGAWSISVLVFYKHGAPNGAFPQPNSIENSEERFSALRAFPSAFAAYSLRIEYCAPVSGPDWPRRGRLRSFAPAAMRASRSSSVSAWLYSFEAAPTALLRGTSSHAKPRSW